MRVENGAEKAGHGSAGKILRGVGLTAALAVENLTPLGNRRIAEDDLV